MTTLLKTLLIISYIIYCDGVQIVCDPKETNSPSAAPTTPETTDVPTPGPTSDPTPEPSTADPTPQPTNDPTTPEPTTTPAPTPQPTKPPAISTPQPTDAPQENAQNPESTPQPNVVITPCQWNPDMDLIILHDISCTITSQHYSDQLQMIGETILAFKSETPQQDIDDNREIPDDRVAYFEFDSSNVFKKIRLDDTTYNVNPVTAANRNQLYLDITQNIKSTTYFQSTLNRNGYPKLDEALSEAYDEFDTYKSNDARDKKIIIFSNCKADSLATIPTICQQVEEQVINKQGVIWGTNIIMVNNGDNFALDDTYIPCLVEYDMNRIYNNPTFDMNDWHGQLGHRAQIAKEICEHPTPAPTSDPTSDPVGVYHRRLYTSDITNGYHNTPCITMQIKLETENLLPLNSDPDLASNIAVIGKAIANITGGVVTIPDTPVDDEEFDENPDAFPLWEPFEFDSSCDGLGTPQMTEQYVQDGTWSTGVLEAIRTEETGGFKLTVPMTTEDSAMYVYKFNNIPLNVLYDGCSSDIILYCGIYDENEVVLMGGALASVTVSPSNIVQAIEFTWPTEVVLQPDSVYKIIFTGTYPIGTGTCGPSSITLGSTSTDRRRLVDYEVTSETSASACVAGNSLAKSKSMKAAVNAMCNGNTLNFDNMKESLYRQHNSAAQIADHLIKLGSITLYDPENGEQTFNTAGFPEHNVIEPCIAVDEDNKIIYAIGGKIATDNPDGSQTFTAVKYIQAYQLNQDDITQAGTVLTFEGTNIATGRSATWELDGPLYGATCVYYDDGTSQYLVVVGGMDDPALEFTDKNAWSKEIRMYKKPTERNGIKYISPSRPEDRTINQLKPLNNMRPLLVNNYLYTFGGKTHKGSVPIVDMINLDQVISGSSDAGWTNTLTLQEKKSLPSIDRTEYDGNGCYAAFAGQSYANYILTTGEDGLNANLFQLFCNPAVPQLSTARRSRRLSEEITKTFTDFDLEMLRRNLQGGNEATEVYIRTYDWTLDGIWYNFTVTFELCYDNNDELSDAVEYYGDVIDDKPDGEKWEEYDEEISEKILNCSLDVYGQWSDGFGAVNVFDLDILDIRFEPIIDYSTHPERRKGRFWWTNLGDRNENDDDWIDDKIEYSDCDDDEE